MIDFYTPAQRALQDEFTTRPLADGLAATIVTHAITPEQAEFIHRRDMFFLATLDETGLPSCSYKGGAPGFVRVTGERTLVFPNYDGNGMFMSAGNIAATGMVGLLFVDFERPHRLRVRGKARVLRDGAILASYPGADLAVEVEISEAWQNCPRYVHRMTRMVASPYLPDEDGEAPFALWKRIDAVQEVLPAADRRRAAELGLITAAEYESRLTRGEFA